MAPNVTAPLKIFQIISEIEKYSIGQQIKKVHPGSQFLGFANVIKCLFITYTWKKWLEAIAFVVSQGVRVVDGIDEDKTAPGFIVGA